MQCDGVFRGDLCMPCHEMITTGKVHRANATFIGTLSRKAAFLDKYQRDIEKTGLDFGDEAWPSS